MFMAKCKLIALTTPLPGKEAEYHDWYQNTHLKEVLAIPGGVSAQRFQLVAKLMGADPNTFLAIYDFEADDPGAVLAAMGAAAQSGKMTQSDTQDFSTTYTAFFVEAAP
jgi:hypothetical protein